MAESLQPVIGYILTLRNAGLGLELFGSPREIVDEARKQNLDLSLLAAHAQTEIRATEVLRRSPRLSFSGGPHAESIADLLEAIEESNIPAATTILKRDPDSILSAHSGAAIPLFAAVAARDSDMVTLFLQAGVAVDSKGEFAMTALHWSAAVGATSIVAQLLGAGAEAERTSDFYVTAGDLASINNRVAVSRLIADRSGVGASSDFSLEPVLNRMGKDARRRLR